MKKYIIALGLIIVLLVAGCATQDAEKETIKLNVFTWAGYAPFILAEEKGFFTDEGVNVESTWIEDVGERRVAMASGNIDFESATLDIVSLNIVNGVDEVVVLELDRSNGGDGIVATNDIKTVADLKGKTIATRAGDPGHFLLLYLLHEAGLSEDDVIIQDMDAGAAGAAFVAGQVDAAATWEPWISQAVEREDGSVLITSADAPGLIVDVLAGRTEFVDNNPEETKAVLRAWFKALKFKDEHPEEAYQILADAMKLSVAEYKDIESGLTWTYYEDNVEDFGTKENPGKMYDVMRNAQKIWYDEGVSDKQINADDYMRPEFIQNLY